MGTANLIAEEAREREFQDGQQSSRQDVGGFAGQLDPRQSSATLSPTAFNGHRLAGASTLTFPSFREMRTPCFFELALRLGLELVALTQRIFALRTGT